MPSAARVFLPHTTLQNLFFYPVWEPLIPLPDRKKDMVRMLQHYVKSNVKSHVKSNLNVSDHFLRSYSSSKKVFYIFCFSRELHFSVTQNQHAKAAKELAAEILDVVSTKTFNDELSN